MTITEVQITSPAATTGLTSLTVSPLTIGNLEVFYQGLFGSSSTTAFPTGYSGGGVTTWTTASSTLCTDGTSHAMVFTWGAVTSTGSSTLSVSGTSSPWSTTSVKFYVVEFSSSVAGIWSLDTSNHSSTQSTSGATLSSPSLTPAGPNELAVYGWVSNPAGHISVGSTPGYTYGAVLGSVSQVAWNTAVSAATSPTEANSGTTAYGVAGALFHFTEALSAAVSDSAMAAGSVSRVGGPGRSVADNAKASPGLSRGALAYQRALSDGAAAAGSANRKIAAARSVANGAAASDSVATRRASGRTISNNAKATGVLSRHVTTSRGIADGALATGMLSPANRGRFVRDGAVAFGSVGQPVYRPAPVHSVAYRNPDQIAVSKLEVWTPDGLDFLGTLDFDACSVNFNETRQVRRQGTMAAASKGFPFDALIPVKGGDLLHPATLNEIRPYRGWRYQDGKEVYWPLGSFRFTPTIPHSPGSIEMTFELSDPSVIISSQRWTEPYPIAAGTNLGLAIAAIVADRWPPAIPMPVLNFQPTTIELPATVLGSSPGSSNDPYADILKLASDAGMELFFDVHRALVMRLVQDPTTAPVVWQFEAVEGGALLTSQRILDISTTYNGVQAVGNANSSAPVSVEVWDDNPESDAYYEGPLGKVPYPYETSSVPGPGQSEADAEAQLLVAATAILQVVAGALDSTSYDAIPNPAMQDGDCALLSDPKIGINDNYVCSSYEMPLDVGSPMTVTNRPRRQVTVG